MFKDLKNTLWGETLKINLLRSIVAGVVWMVISFILGIIQPEGYQSLKPWYTAFLMPIIMPIAYFGFVLPFTLVFGWFGSLFPFGGLIKFAASLIPIFFIVPADPFMYLLHKNKPNLVPIDKYNFIIWNPFILVLTEMRTVIYNEEETTQNDSVCPFAGHVLVDKETKVLGFSWPAKSTAFLIQNDWLVSTPGDHNFGWIDINGEIHKGRPFGEIEPKATLSGGATGIKIVGDSCWIGNDKIGDLVKW